MCSHVEARGRCWLSSSIALHCSFGDNLLLNLELSNCPDWLASKLLRSSCLGLQARANSPNLLCGCGGCELRPACLPSKHFLYWAVSPAPHLVVVFLTAQELPKMYRFPIPLAVCEWSSFSPVPASEILTTLLLATLMVLSWHLIMIFAGTSPVANDIDNLPAGSPTDPRQWGVFYWASCVEFSGLFVLCAPVPLDVSLQPFSPM